MWDGLKMKSESCILKQPWHGEQRKGWKEQEQIKLVSCSQNECVAPKMRVNSCKWEAQEAHRGERIQLWEADTDRGDPTNQPTKQGESTVDKVELFLCQTLQNILSHRSRKQCRNNFLLCQQLESMQCWLQSKLVDEHSLMARKMLLLKKHNFYVWGWNKT